MKKNPELSKSLTMRSNRALLKIIGSLFLLLALSFSPVLAGENFLSEKIQLKVDNVSLKDALKEIERQSTFTFLYNDALIDVNQTLSISSKEQSVKELLDQILTKRGINYTIIENQIVLTKAAAKMQDNKRTITGKIFDSESKQALPGVPILIKGTTSGTVTDLDGNFTLSVTEDAILSITYVGYVTEEIPVVNRTDFSIGLVPDIINLEDVVVIGYGTIKKSDITGAVASVSAEQLQQAAVSGVDQALQGRTAGVAVTSNSGSPGTAPTIRIRGTATINNADPLFVVDGIPIPASEVGNLNPGDIERTEILKDASSSAIYGARAANGVVLITTKRGKEGTSSVNFDGYVGVQSLARKYEIMNAQDFISIRNAAGNPKEDSSMVKNTDWQDEIFRKAKIRSYQLSFAGGSEKSQYALIGSYYNQEGIIKGTDYERYTFRLNTATDIKKWLKVGENISYNYSLRNILNENDEYSSTVVSAINMDPATPVYVQNPDSGNITDPYSNYSAAVRNNINNPVGLIERNNNKIKNTSLMGNVFTDIKPFEWLTYRLSLGSEWSNYDEEVYLPAFTESVSNLRINNQLIKGNFNYKTMIWENTLTFHKVMAEKHDLTLLVGYSQQSNALDYNVRSITNVPEISELRYFNHSSNLSSLVYRDYEFLYTDFPALGNSVIRDLSVFNDGIVRPYEDITISYLGRMLYTYNGKYDLHASIRRDGSSKFGSNKQWGWFPSFAAGWKISEEEFMKDLSFISFLKLRFGWGTLGNQEAPPYAVYTPIQGSLNYTTGTYPNQNTIPGGAPTSIKNEDIAWATVKMINYGVDLNLFENKINLNADYFVKTTTDMLVAAPIPGVTGVQTPPTVNKGSVENRGLELNLILKSKLGDFSYEIGGNIGFVKNKVVKLGAEGDAINGGSFRATTFISRTEKDQPIASFYGYKTDGLWQSQEEIDAANQLAKETSGDPKAYYDSRFTSPGDVKFVDLNGDNTITAEDRDFIGSPHPDITYGINISLKYKIFDFTLFGQGVKGNEVVQALIYYNQSPNGYWNMDPAMKDYWTPTNTNTSIPRLDMRSSNNNLRFSDRYIKDGSFFRIKNIQFGINLPSEICNMIKVEKVRFYLAAQNLKTWTKYKGFDPEIGTGNSNLDIGIDRGNYPIAKSYMVGLNFTF